MSQVVVDGGDDQNGAARPDGPTNIESLESQSSGDSPIGGLPLVRQTHNLQSLIITRVYVIITPWFRSVGCYALSYLALSEM